MTVTIRTYRRLTYLEDEYKKPVYVTRSNVVFGYNEEHGVGWTLFRGPGMRD